MKKTFLLILAFILVFALGVFAGSKIKKGKTPQGVENSYQAGWDAAKQRIEQTGLGGPKMDNIEIKTISGTIEKIESNKITIKAMPLGALSDPALDSRIITVSNDTKIFQLTQKDPAQLQKEMDEFQSKMKALEENKEQSTENITPVQPQDKKQVQLSDLKVGQQVSITSTENIKDKKEFAASEISIMEMPNLPGTPENLPTPPIPTAPTSSTAPTTLPTPTAS